LKEAIDRLGLELGGELEKDPIEFGIDWRVVISGERIKGGMEVERRYINGEEGEGG
jgi:hypothetical protein